MKSRRLYLAETECKEWLVEKTLKRNVVIIFVNQSSNVVVTA